VNGYLPKTSLIDLKSQCDEFGNSLVKEDEGFTDVDSSPHTQVGVIDTV